MADKRKNTKDYVKENLDIPLYEELFVVNRRNNTKKKGEVVHTWRPKDNVHSNPLYHNTNRETSLSSNSENTRLFSGTFSTHLYANQDFQDKTIPPMGEPMCKSISFKEMNQQVRNSNTQQKSSQSTFVPFIEKNIIDLDTTTIDSDDTTIEQEELMNEVKVLRKRVVEEDARHLHLEKEREKATINALWREKLL